MKRSDYIWKSFRNAAGVLVYVSAVAGLMFRGEDIFGGEDTFLIPVFMLLLFIVSATLTGLMVLANPIQIYLNGQRKDALFLLFATLGWLVIFLAVIIAVFLLR